MEAVAIANEAARTDAGAMLARLFEVLERRMTRRVRCVATARDVAAETVLRAIRRFFSGASSPSVTWPPLWAWSVRVADHLLSDLARAAKRARIDRSVLVDALPVVTVGDPCESTRIAAALAFVAELRLRLRQSERETLQCLLAGTHENAVIAEQRGLTIRAVQKSRCRLSAAATAVWKESRAVRLRTFLSS